MTDTAVEARPWRITWRGSSWGESDLKGKHLAVLALMTGRDDWDALEIDPRNGHQRLMMMISALVTVDRTEGTDIEDPEVIATQLAESMSEVSEAPAEEILAALTQD